MLLRHFLETGNKVGVIMLYEGDDFSSENIILERVTWRYLLSKLEEYELTNAEVLRWEYMNGWLYIGIVK